MNTESFPYRIEVSVIELSEKRLVLEAAAIMNGERKLLTKCFNPALPNYNYSHCVAHLKLLLVKKYFRNCLNPAMIVYREPEKTKVSAPDITIQGGPDLSFSVNNK